MALTFERVTRENLARCRRWHAGGIEEWSVADWAVAMAGEAGEVCNAVKKLRRIEDGLANISDPARQLSTRQEAVDKIGEELADTFLYLNLLACRLGVDLAAAIVAKFNATSARYGFPERLSLDDEAGVPPALEWQPGADGESWSVRDPSGIVLAEIRVWRNWGEQAEFYTAAVLNGHELGEMNQVWPNLEAACQAVEAVIGQPAKRAGEGGL